MTDTDGDRPVDRLELPYRARFDECGPDGIVRTSALLRYAQDIAWIHSERLGFGRQWYADRNLAWVVRAVELAVLAPLRLGETIELTTAVTGFRRVWSRRRTEGRREDGSLALWAHTDWVMTDTVRGLPGRVPDVFPAAFAVAPGTFEPGRVSLPATPPGAQVLRTVVRPQDLDPMGHVNNATYVDYLEEAMLAAGGLAAQAIAAVPRRVRLEYVAAAAPGAALDGAAWRLVGPAADRASGERAPGGTTAGDDAVGAGGGDGWAWRLVDEAGRELTRGRVHGGDGSDA